MSIKQKFMKTFSVSQYPDSYEYDIILRLRNCSICSIISDVVNYFDHNVSSSDNTLDDLKIELQKLQCYYREIESNAQKVFGLCYSKCIPCAESSNEIYEILEDVHRYKKIFDKIFEEWKKSINKTIPLLNSISKDLNDFIELMIDRYDAIVYLFEDYFNFIEIPAREMLNLIEALQKNAHNDVFSSNRHKHLNLSETDRTEFYNLSHTMSFNSLLFKYIDEAGITDPNVYKAAGISKQVFSYIRNNKLHSLKKENIVSICIVLKLDMEKTLRLLASCGYGLSEYVAFDKIISFCISNDCYDVDEINELLYEYDQPTICGTT